MFYHPIYPPQNYMSNYMLIICCFLSISSSKNNCIVNYYELQFYQPYILPGNNYMSNYMLITCSIHPTYPRCKITTKISIPQYLILGIVPADLMEWIEEDSRFE